MNEELIAPCGMNCALCSSYLAQKNELKSRGIRMPYCSGCRPRNKQCAFLKKRCTLLGSGQIKSCHECSDFPCDNLRKLDKRYQGLYRMSMIANLVCIKEHGIRALLEKETEKWRCARCGELICCHNGLCYRCDREALKNKKNPFRWGDEGTPKH
jgi:hypothetical protein